MASNRARLFAISIVLNWNGSDLPEQIRKQMPAELQDLPPGRYVLDPVDQIVELTAEQEAGIQAAIDSVRQGKGMGLDGARAQTGRITNPREESGT